MRLTTGGHDRAYRRRPLSPPGDTPTRDYLTMREHITRTGATPMMRRRRAESSSARAATTDYWV